MSIPEIDPAKGVEAIADAQLQQELYGLFILDTQTYLQRYSQIVQQLNSQSWRADIQEMYRCIHTIKGGAVTVAAEAALYCASALEDVLSDLRFLEQLPPSTEQYLNQALLEAGELLAGTLELQQEADLEPILNRIRVVHQMIRERYLPQWDEQRQIQKEFAEQGLDLVVLELEIALEQLPHEGQVPDTTINEARQTLAQLEKIGQDLGFASGWKELLNQAEELFTCLENAVWRSQWLLLFQALKSCARQQGNSIAFKFQPFDAHQLNQNHTTDYTDYAFALELQDSLDALSEIGIELLDTNPELLDTNSLDTDSTVSSTTVKDELNQSDIWLDEPGQESASAIGIELEQSEVWLNDLNQIALPDVRTVEPEQPDELLNELSQGSSPDVAASMAASIEPEQLDTELNELTQDALSEVEVSRFEQSNVEIDDLGQDSSLNFEAFIEAFIELEQSNIGFNDLNQVTSPDIEAPIELEQLDSGLDEPTQTNSTEVETVEFEQSEVELNDLNQVTSFNIEASIELEQPDVWLDNLSQDASSNIEAPSEASIELEQSDVWLNDLNQVVSSDIETFLDSRQPDVWLDNLNQDSSTDVEASIEPKQPDVWLDELNQVISPNVETFSEAAIASEQADVEADRLNQIAPSNRDILIDSEQPDVWLDELSQETSSEIEPFIDFEQSDIWLDELSQETSPEIENSIEASIALEQSDVWLDDLNQGAPLGIGVELSDINPSLQPTILAIDSLIDSEETDIWSTEPAEQETFAEVDSFLDKLHQDDLASFSIGEYLDLPTVDDESTELAEVESFTNEQNQIENRTDFEAPDQPLKQDEQDEQFADLSQLQDWLKQHGYNGDRSPDSPQEQEQPSAKNELSESQTDPALANLSPFKPNHTTDTVEKVQIPVTLDKLNQSSQHLVETLLALRTAQGFYQTLHAQVTQLVALAQEGVQYIAHLRQIQDDYALLDQLKNHTDASQGPTPERYRQGYTVINRLLETNLRLSEIGAESGRTAQQVGDSLRSIDSNILKLQNTVEDSRLVPFYNLGFRARAVLRDLMTRFSKPAQLVIEGEQTELDVRIVRDLEPALLHLIRNAYGHGLESPTERVAQGKPEQGTITLSLQRQGNTFQLEFSDDGRGIDAEAVQARAKSLDLPLTSTHTPADLLAVISQPGFSSEVNVNDLSGRGIGMDVVVAQIARLGGQLSLNTVLGKGTTFRLQFPVPRLLVSCLIVRSGDYTFAMPVDDIKTTDLVSNFTVTQINDPDCIYSWAIQDETGLTPALDLVEYWRSRSVGRPLSDTTICIYAQDQDTQQGIWLLADELLEQSDLLINPLPAPLVAPEGLIGVNLQTNGALIPVLEARALAKWLLASPAKRSATVTDQFIPQIPEKSLEEHSEIQSILVVDDAALMRRRLEISLNSYGYITHTCVDGRDAWHWLQEHSKPSLVITDIEMPNMDGFTLISHCRQAGMTVPILVISSRLSEEWFTEAKRLGATDYLTKGFSSAELLNKVNSLLSLTIH